MVPSSVSELTRPTVSVPYVGLLTPMNPCELSNWPSRLESLFAPCRTSALPLFCTSERCPLVSSPEYGSKPASTVPTSDQFGNHGIGSLIAMPMTDWLMPLGVHSHLEPLDCLVTKLLTACG